MSLSRSTYGLTPMEEADDGEYYSTHQGFAQWDTRVPAAELKGMDTELSNGLVTSAMSVLNNHDTLNHIYAGAAAYQRIGRKITLKSLRLRLLVNWRYVRNYTNLTIPANTLRIVVVYDSHPNGQTVPPFDAVFGTTDNGGVQNTIVLDPLKYSQMGRYRVLRDIVLPLSAKCTPAPLPVDRTVAAPGPATDWVAHTRAQDDMNQPNYVDQRHIIDEYINLDNRPAEFTTNSLGDDRDLTVGRIVLYARTELMSGTTTSFNYCELEAGSMARLRYTE